MYVYVNVDVDVDVDVHCTAWCSMSCIQVEYVPDRQALLKNNVKYPIANFGNLGSEIDPQREGLCTKAARD